MIHSGDVKLSLYIYLIAQSRLPIGERVQNWRRGRDERLPVKESDVRELFIPFQGKLLQYQHSCENVSKRQQNRFWRCNPPYDSTAHFMGKEKPWLGQHVRDEKSIYGQHGAKGQWFAELEKINDKINMSIDIEHWNSKIAPHMKDVMLGEMAMFKDQEDVLGTI